ncbi:hypothetical protein [Candidatus Phytoplasma rubi]|uniref:hypothetical protein n=1 Tax=Candidatus Phytoplasma rubi TaxID=399025 RepID=UPI002286C591|nr:hypothetical protein [Candidatus Phytoplasma rubi]
MKRQEKENKIRRILQKTNIKDLKIIILKNCSKKTHLKRNNNILFVNDKVNYLVKKELKKCKLEKK